VVNKWDIYYCNLNPVKGSEQKGSRPVLVVSSNAVNHSIPVSTILPFSSVKEGATIYPTEVFIPPEASGLQKNSVVMIQQIRTLSHNRLGKRIAHLENREYQKNVLDALKDYFEYE